MQDPTVVAGVDGYPKGWVAVVLEGGRFRSAHVGRRLADIVDELATASAIGVDIPIGLPEHGPRPADRLARARLGPRWRSVFLAPPRAVLEMADHAGARRMSVELEGRSIPAQAYALRAKVFEADAIARDDARIHEVHPELSFAEMGGRPLAPKSTWTGLLERRRLLAEHGIVVPDGLGAAGAAGPDDVLDAAAAAWSAHRIAMGRAESLPPDPTPGPDGHAAAIWV